MNVEVSEPVLCNGWLVLPDRAVVPLPDRLAIRVAQESRGVQVVAVHRIGGAVHHGCVRHRFVRRRQVDVAGLPRAVGTTAQSQEPSDCLQSVQPNSEGGVCDTRSSTFL